MQSSPVTDAEHSASPLPFRLLFSAGTWQEEEAAWRGQEREAERTDGEEPDVAEVCSHLIHREQATCPSGVLGTEPR